MPGQYTDKDLSCVDCGAPFTFTSGEQERFAELGFTNEPKRCSPCRAAKKAKNGGGNGGGRGPSGPRSSSGGPKEMHVTVCAGCGGEARVPFVPSGNRPVYCSSCFDRDRKR